MTDIRIALAGNPNSGKTTLFNVLTGSNQFVGNWPGVTVEKKEGRLKWRNDVIVTDLPGVYSLSPYTLEEVVARTYLIDDHPDAILNIIDGTNLERNLYLTTQLTELGIPVVLAINMMDVVRKNGDVIDTAELSRRLGCRIVEISALKETGLQEAVEAAIDAVEHSATVPMHMFSGIVEHALAHIEEAAVHGMSEERQRWYSIKIFERDVKVLESLKIPTETLSHIEGDIRRVEKELDDDSEAIIINERYSYIESVLKTCYKRKHAGELTVSDKIDRIVTNRWLGLPVFAVIMLLVYYVSMIGIGQRATEWANGGLFGTGWHLLGIGSSDWSSACERYEAAHRIVDAYDEIQWSAGLPPAIGYEVEDRETHVVETMTATVEDYRQAKKTLESFGNERPAPQDYGVWVPGVPVVVERFMDTLRVSATGAGAVIRGVVLDGMISGVGIVLGFVPQLLVLFLCLSFLEACGYMSRIAFVLDRVFRQFGLSGKSFIPLLVGTGCGVPGIMASRTIENERDRRMTVMTTTFIPCGAKVPFISMMAGALFGGSAWVATSAYLVGLAAVIVSGLMLKKTSLFAGEPAPFVMELPAYHLPMLKNILYSTWDRGWSFIKKAGTVIMLSSMLVWFASSFGFADGGFRMLGKDELGLSLLGRFGNAVAWLFSPLGWGSWETTVASLTGLVAKENIVGTIGVLYGTSGDVYGVIAERFSCVTGYSFLVFNLLCAPCVAAMGAIRREMNSAFWTWFAIGYQCVFAYGVALMVTQFGYLFMGTPHRTGLIAAVSVLVLMLFMVFRRGHAPSPVSSDSAS